jgi:hypothetical protein
MPKDVENALAADSQAHMYPCISPLPIQVSRMMFARSPTHP